MASDPRDECEMLPVDRSWEYEHDGQITDVMVSLGVVGVWPEVMVRITPRGSGLQVEGTFSKSGRLRVLEFTATGDDGEVVPADLRRSSVIRALKSWEIVAREIARQILSGVPARDTVIDARTPTEALRSLMQATGRAPGSRLRGAAAEEQLRQVADAYRELLAAGDPSPRKTLASRFNYSPEHIGRLLVQARKTREGRPPLLGPARPGKAGETAPP